MVHTGSALNEHDAANRYRSYYLIFAASFIVFLAIALAGQLLGWHWRAWLPGAEGVKSLFGGVKAAVYTFMSHLT
jgi:light-harvesting complex 1 beta chain